MGNGFGNRLSTTSPSLVILKGSWEQTRKADAMKQHNYFVYITANPSKTVLYVGVTNDLFRRLIEHRENRGKPETFAGKYFCYKLLYYERHTYVQHAIDREKEIKQITREEKEVLIRSLNPKMLFLKIAD